MANISIHGSHNASIAIENNGKIIEVIEVERFLNLKNSGLVAKLSIDKNKDVVNSILYYIKNKYGFTKFDICFYSYMGRNISSYIKANKYIECLHHEVHAANSFYQSNDEEALIISFDGGGTDGCFNIYHATRENGIKYVHGIDIDMGLAYSIFGDYISDVKKEDDINMGTLVYSGKLMGLSSYGVLNQNWIKHFKEYYKNFDFANAYKYEEKLQVLGDNINVKFDKNIRLEGQLAWDIVANSQIAFEEVFYELTAQYLENFPSIPLHITGGCALNILLNTRLKKDLNRTIFIVPNSSDCGLAVGMLLNHIKPKNAEDITYKGVSVLDENTLMEYVEDYKADFYNYEEIANDLLFGKIIGIVRNGSEHGARALGNRSIICNPSFEDMKDILNFKVKNREWYRPFAPIVRLEDVSKYFEFEGESRWMSFCPKVKQEWIGKLPSITHIDNTARVQTVTKEQNEWLYDLITEFEKKSGIGVLLNTSFNIAGKPIVSTYRDAVALYESSKMDRLLLQDFYIKTKK